jgi:pheromone alpha factor receptor
LIALFTILEYVKVDNFPNAGTLSLTMVALLLPFSSLWAGLAIKEESSTLNLSNLNGSSDSVRRGSENGSYDPRKTCNSQFSQSTSPSTACGGFSIERKSSAVAGMGMDSRIEHVPEHRRRDSTEMDLEAMGVRIDHSYSVHSGQ